MIYIGIDPDTHKSGVAIWSSKDKHLQLFTMTFFELYDFLKTKQKAEEFGVLNYKIIIEAGWLNKKSNFHSKGYQTKESGERISKNVGANHETGRKIVEMCEYLGLEYELVRPSKAKMTSQYFESMTGLKVKNQDMIDAGVLVFGR